ncbi:MULTISPECIES: phage integrase family protein [Ralstonia]|jgi:site-specific recombinase XerD|uniref:Site-specific integrase n=8 Tax=Ralstonia TaxID=48736 RepID=A0A2P4RAC7_RALPI|nr:MULTISPECIES: phage integrase family protein [Ralstonia]MBA4231841.1 integrase [Ralstonia sp.]MBA4235779.1 integrase [Ralstonia sp.]MBA9847494.1 integrase [Ralstonia pickettii]MBA9852926.1 integrase [Ralstonia pickettii]MBA9856837.1 integrase [Ralstonia insidiosa]
MDPLDPDHNPEPPPSLETLQSEIKRTRPTRRRVVVRRHLHRGHFAFLRAVVQGLDARPMWARYLAIDGELEAQAELTQETFVAHPKVRRMTAWLRAELAAAVRRAGHYGKVRLIRIDLSGLAQRGPALPALEEFALENGLDDFSIEEQLEAYRERFGDAVQRAERRTKLMERQLRLLADLEQVLAEPVRVDDHCHAWLAAGVADRLEAAGVATIGTLIDRINSLGGGWFRALRGVGEKKAHAIERFLRANADTLARKLGEHARIPRRQLTAHERDRVVASGTGLLPLEKIVVPAALDGSNGRFRRPPVECLLDAQNDYEAVLTWLRSKPGLPPAEIARRRTGRRDVITEPGPLDWLHYLSNTQRSYRKEAERFLLWAIWIRRKPLSSMTTEDCVAYRDFLADVPDDWCAPRSRERWTPSWKPFEGKLSPESQAYALTVLQNLYRYLNDKNYLSGNPWGGVRATNGGKPQLDVGRSLTEDQWAFVVERLFLLERTSSNLRLQVALPLLYATGLRLAEIVGATTADLAWRSLALPRSGERMDGWWLTVVGKGSRVREVPVPDEVVHALGAYLDSRGFPSDPAQIREPVALLGHATDQAERAPWAKRDTASPAAPLTPGVLYRQIKRFFQACATELEATDPQGAARLNEASTHWLRHSHASHAIAAGTPVEIMQQNLGHKSLDTTTVYVTSEEAIRMKELRGFWKRS